MEAKGKKPLSLVKQISVGIYVCRRVALVLNFSNLWHQMWFSKGKEFDFRVVGNKGKGRERNKQMTHQEMVLEEEFTGLSINRLPGPSS